MYLWLFTCTQCRRSFIWFLYACLLCAFAIGDNKPSPMRITHQQLMNALRETRPSVTASERQRYDRMQVICLLLFSLSGVPVWKKEESNSKKTLLINVLFIFHLSVFDSHPRAATRTLTPDTAATPTSTNRLSRPGSRWLERGRNN